MVKTDVGRVLLMPMAMGFAITGVHLVKDKAKAEARVLATDAATERVQDVEMAAAADKVTVVGKGRDKDSLLCSNLQPNRLATI